MTPIHVIVSEGAVVKELEGELIRLPLGLRTPVQNEYYRRAPRGWTRCPRGYAVYVHNDSEGRKYVAPGIILENEARPHKKFYAQPFALKREQVVQIVKSISEERERVQSAFEEQLGGLIHDLRALSSTIYNAAVDAKHEYSFGNQVTASDRIETVIAAQTMLSLRIDFLDYYSKSTMTGNEETISVFKKVDKVVRCYRPRAASKGVSIHLAGPSFASTSGPPIFELVPYAVVENAVKYSPGGRNIYVQVNDREHDISIQVRSYGPLIEEREMQSIFEKGYRGLHATDTGKPGTGLGLAAAKDLVENYFYGSISCSQQSMIERIGGVAYFETEFDIVVPRIS